MCTIAQLCWVVSSQPKHVSTIRKDLLKAIPHPHVLIFSSRNLSRRRLDVYHTCTHGVHGLSANLGCRSETCCCAARGSLEMQHAKNRQKVAICAPSYNFAGLYILATKAPINNRKNLVKRQYLLRCLHNIINFGRLAAEIVR